MNAIEIAVSPLKENARTQAAAYAVKVVANVAKELAAAGFDLNIVAPYPKAWGGTRADYKMGVAKRGLFSRLTTSRDMTKERGIDIVAMDQKQIDRFITQAMEDASTSYEAYVAKLVAKIGPVVDAKLSGDALWTYSELTVTKEDGTTETWRTQMILNVSGLGTVFNQWPTRKVKRAA